MDGADAGNQDGIYGDEGTAASGNAPGSREQSISWIDSSGNFWLFGGDGYDSAGTNGFLNDLWKYSAGQWTWTGGSAVANQSGTYGGLGVVSSSNMPGARNSELRWIDNSGNLWLFGGGGYDSAGTLGTLNDLWEFNSGQWTWMSGSNIANQSGVYGILGQAAPDNIPGGRFHGVSWIDGSGNFWVFGGNIQLNTGQLYLNDCGNTVAANGHGWEAPASQTSRESMARREARPRVISPGRESRRMPGPTPLEISGSMAATDTIRLLPTAFLTIYGSTQPLRGSGLG
jgi:hypothetical protein